MIYQSQWDEIEKSCPGIEIWQNELKRKKLIMPDKVRYTDAQVNNKIEEAKEKLEKLRVKEPNKMTALVLLALLNMSPVDEWSKANNKSYTLSNGIMKFVSENYNMEYKANTRESFRREGINVLLNNNLIVLNPDNPNLGPTSPNTHYAVRVEILNRIKLM